MKFKVICNRCRQSFLAESQQYGRVRYRCPHCGQVVTCQLDPPVSTAKRAANRSQRMARAVSATAQATGTRLSRFQQEHKNGDLWLFFGFSFFFVLSVIVGLLLFAAMAKLIQSGQSWLFKTWLEVSHSF